MYQDLIASKAALRSTLYRPRRGDTLVTIADRFGVTVAQLRRWNHLGSAGIVPGHGLYVSEPAHISGLRYGKKRRAGTKTAAAHPAKKKSA